jgi:hypothetical protein
MQKHGSIRNRIVGSRRRLWTKFVCRSGVPFKLLRKGWRNYPTLHFG